MKAISAIVGVLGLLVILAGVIGRFKGSPAVWVFGHAHTASAIILAGNTLLLTAIWLGLVAPEKKN